MGNTERAMINEESRIQAGQLETRVNPEHQAIYDAIRAGTMQPAELSRILDQDGLVPECLTITGFEDRLRFYLENSITGTIVAIDVDDFKKFNDTEGHPAGDDLLRLTGNILDRQTRVHPPTADQLQKRQHGGQQLDLIARAGDEFLWFLVGAEVEDAEKAAIRVRSNLGSGVRLYFPGFGPDQNMSLGITPVQLTDDVRTARQRADQALYEAKGNKGLENNTGVVVKIDF